MVAVKLRILDDVYYPEAWEDIDITTLIKSDSYLLQEIKWMIDVSGRAEEEDEFLQDL